MSTIPDPLSFVLFRPNPDKAFPIKVGETFDAASKAAHDLFMQAFNGPNQALACNRLIHHGSVICGYLESMWKDLARRPILEAEALKINYFPLLHTNLKPVILKVKINLILADDMREKLRLRQLPGYEKNRRGRPSANDELNLALHQYIMGVLEPGSLLNVMTADQRQKKDIISRELRSELLSPKMRHNLNEWAKAFVAYVLKYRPGLFSHDEKSCALYKQVVALREQRMKSQRKNKDAPCEKGGPESDKEALTQLVLKRMKKFKPLIAAR